MMKTVSLLLLVAVLDIGVSYGSRPASQADTSAHNPCFDLKAFPSSEADIAALKRLLSLCTQQI